MKRGKTVMKINLTGADKTGLCRKCSKPYPRGLLRKNKGYCPACRPKPAVNQ